MIFIFLNCQLEALRGENDSLRDHSSIIFDDYFPSQAAPVFFFRHDVFSAVESHAVLPAFMRGPGAAQDYGDIIYPAVAGFREIALKMFMAENKNIRLSAEQLHQHRSLLHAVDQFLPDSAEFSVYQVIEIEGVVVQEDDVLASLAPSGFQPFLQIAALPSADRAFGEMQPGVIPVHRVEREEMMPAVGLDMRIRCTGESFQKGVTLDVILLENLFAFRVPPSVLAEVVVSGDGPHLEAAFDELVYIFFRACVESLIRLIGNVSGDDQHGLVPGPAVAVQQKVFYLDKSLQLPLPAADMQIAYLQNIIRHLNLSPVLRSLPTLRYYC